MYVIPPPPTKRTCVTCRIEFALGDTTLCAACDSKRLEECDKLTHAIQAYERTFYKKFERSDEVWVKISETESILTVPDITDHSISNGKSSFPAAKAAEDPSALIDDQTCIPAPAGHV